MRHHRTGDRRGMALVMVLIFGVAAFMLVITLLSLTRASAKVEGERHRDKNLHAVARYGLAMAANEVNRHRADATFEDPTGNGFGCILTDPVDGQRGFAVRDTGGAVLGRFTTMITMSDDGARQTLDVVAVSGEFPASAVDAQAKLLLGLQVVTAQLEIWSTDVPPITSVMTFDRNALSIRGAAGAGGRQGFYAPDDSANQVYIRGNTVPAVNISDQTMYRMFTGRNQETGTFDPTSLKLMAWAQLDGFDPVAGGAATGTTTAAGRDTTVTNDEAGLLSQETLERVARGVDAFVADTLSGGQSLQAAAPGKIDGAGKVTADITLPNGTYYINSPLEIPAGRTLKGEGTLIINAGVAIKNTLDWKGDIVIANNDAAKVRVDGKLRVDGVLVVQGYRVDNEAGTPSKMGLTVKGTLMVGKPDDGSPTGNWSSNAKGAINPASFVILGDAYTENPLVFESGNAVDVRGIASIMGNALKMDFSTGANVKVYGSLNTVSPGDAATGLDIKFRNGAHIELEYMEGNFDKSAEKLMTFFVAGDELIDDEPPPPPPIVIRAYLEAPRARNELLAAGIEAASAGDYGVTE